MTGEPSFVPFAPWKLAMLVPSKPGVYMLSRDGVERTYVGRADDNLFERLPQSMREHRGCNFFAFQSTATLEEAYEMECRWWHEYQPVENKIHPDAPAGYLLGCPVPGCPFHQPCLRWLNSHPKPEG